jgi:hypothetical protein
MTTVGIADSNSYHETTSTLLVTYEGNEVRHIAAGIGTSV